MNDFHCAVRVGYNFLQEDGSVKPALFHVDNTFLAGKVTNLIENESVEFRWKPLSLQLVESSGVIRPIIRHGESEYTDTTVDKAIEKISNELVISFIQGSGLTFRERL